MVWLRALNATLAFAIELCMLGAFADWGFHVSENQVLRWLIALGATGAAIALWALWGAPKSSTRLAPPWLYMFEWGMFACAAAALYATGRPRLALTFIVIASANVALWVGLDRSA